MEQTESTVALDVLSIDLPKWPALVVQGDAVTREQAAEILVRTYGWHVSTNDKAWERAVYDAAGIKYTIGKYNYLEPDWQSLDDFRERMGVLNLEYLTNSQIASCYIGGPHGWCSWSGDIGCDSFNIGKWPSVKGVAEEWGRIAEAFPFLRLWAQLFSGETCEDDVRPLVEFAVADGKARTTLPTARKVNPESNLAKDLAGLFTRDRERGCSIETLRAAIEMVRTKRAAA